MLLAKLEQLVAQKLRLQLHLRLLLGAQLVSQQELVGKTGAQPKYRSLEGLCQLANNSR